MASPAAIAAATTTTTTSPKDTAVPSTKTQSKETISYVSCCREERLSCYICVYILTPEDVKVLSSIVNSTRLTAHGLSLKRALARIDGGGLFFRGRVYIYFLGPLRTHKSYCCHMDNLFSFMLTIFKN
jgi:hypothetical protein